MSRLYIIEMDRCSPHQHCQLTKVVEQESRLRNWDKAELRVAITY